MNRSKALAVFYRMLAELLGAGVPVTAALAQAGAGLRGAEGLAERVEMGETITEALGSAPRIFPARHRRLIAMGEGSGRIEQVLQQLATHMEDVARVRAKILAGLVLPAALLHVAALGRPLPMLLLGGSLAEYLLAAGRQIAVMWLAVALVVTMARALSEGARDAIMRSLPWFSGLWRELDVWWLASGMELMVQAGVPSIAATRESAGNCRSPVLAAKLRAAAEVAEMQGMPVGSVLTAGRELPAEVLAQWRIGERSGALDRALGRVARDYQARVEARWQVLAAVAPRIAYGLFVLQMVMTIFAQMGRMQG